MKSKSKFPKIYMGIILAITFIPIVLVIVYSFNQSRINAVWEGFSLKWYAELFRDKDLLISLRNSLVLATISSINAGVVGTLGAVGMSKLNFPGKNILDYVTTIPIMTPEIIMGIAFLSFFSLLSLPFGLLTLVIAHMSFSIPYVYMMVKARLVGLDPSYVEASRDLGASEARAFFDVTLPAILPAMLSGMFLAFAMSMDDVVISIFVTGARFNILPVKIYTQLKTTVSPKINALCTLMFLATVILIMLSRVFGRKKDLDRSFN